MKKLILNLAAVAVTICSMIGLSQVSPAYAVVCPDGTSVNGTLADCEAYNKGGADGSGVNSSVKGNNLMDTLNTIINVVIGIVGFVAVVMMIMGGISFITSQGDTAKVTKARNTILYGVVGLVVALLAFAIVNFVLGNVFTSNSSVWLF